MDVDVECANIIAVIHPYTEIYRLSGVEISRHIEVNVIAIVVIVTVIVIVGINLRKRDIV